VHVTKAVARPVVTAATAGAGNAVVSTTEDIASALTALLSVLLPTLMALVLLSAVLIIGWWLWARERQRRADRSGSA
jgi:hypothetical protein